MFVVKLSQYRQLYNPFDVGKIKNAFSKLLVYT